MKPKKILCLFMCILIVMSSVAVTGTVFASVWKGNVPIIYIRGRGTELYRNPLTDEHERIYPLEYSDDYITTQAKAILPLFAKAIATNQWDDYCDALYNSVAPIFEEITLDKNGEVKDGSNIEWEWPTETLPNRCQSNGLYDFYSYVFRYDWRIDPIECADSLNEYIKQIKAATGCEKVAIISRCYANNIAMAYLTEYGSDDVDTYVSYNTTANGVMTCGQLFSGKIDLNSDAVDRFASEYFDDSTTLNRLIEATVTYANRTYKLDIAAEVLKAIYAKIESNVVPRLIYATYGSMPSYWSMVSDEDYEDAKEFMFGDDESYAGLIEKIDNYHYNVQLNGENTLRECVAAGMKIGVVCKYGYQSVPVTEDSDSVTDNTIRLSEQSFGATCSKIDSVLSNEYISAAQLSNRGTYISPDKQIDASTCLFPDSTWIIKDITHKDFPDCVNYLLTTIANFNGQMTVNDYQEFPQYMIYNEEEGTLSPLTVENGGSGYAHDSIFVVWRNFIQALFDYIKEYIESKQAA